ncbi:hypothetical protein SAMN02745857_04126 [Andreprevotia lacus DSM 23236]|jgi:hypothetical protein|uniref:Uncharacterized protein n=1 Tax=Andreprevotia lacus DSM 23236 TaxID=1121001 RepID=A0A1W1Y0X4_9NEIS|nr:hypothetical protein [Andreprevotia lacus]SMC29785.1 hypothetical protein SAMN02745857_04126 [Andreprevotia lacus DSM 23236]
MADLLPAPATARALALQLSDLEAGTPRQWYWLEIAAVQAQSPARRHAGLWLLRHAGIALLWPWLHRAGLPGLALYERSIAPLWQRHAQLLADGAMLCTALPALLAGFARLPATQAFLAWLLMLGGLVWHVVRTKAPQRPAADRDDTETDEQPGPEDSVGLTGQLLAAGTSPGEALALIAALRARPDSAWASLLPRLPALAPPPPRARTRRMLNGLGWLAGSLPGTLLISWLPSPFALPVATTACALLTWRAKGPAGGALIVLTALLAYACGRLGHVL